uniref:Uncharacterized protein n=1 Tax=Ditylenchus dipsaci TaxID=166011 RepID=A0A915ESE9_9BILA
MESSECNTSIKNVARTSRSEASIDSVPCLTSNGDTEKRQILANKLVMLQKEERALKSFLAELRTQHAKLTIENMRLGKISEKRKDEVMSDESATEEPEDS